jgi:hypothetical protein
MVSEDLANTSRASYSKNYSTVALSCNRLLQFVMWRASLLSTFRVMKMHSSLLSTFMMLNVNFRMHLTIAILTHYVPLAYILHFYSFMQIFQTYLYSWAILNSAE